MFELYVYILQCTFELYIYFLHCTFEEYVYSLRLNYLSANNKHENKLLAAQWQSAFRHYAPELMKSTPDGSSVTTTIVN